MLLSRAIPDFVKCFFSYIMILVRGSSSLDSGGGEESLAALRGTAAVFYGRLGGRDRSGDPVCGGHSGRMGGPPEMPRARATLEGEANSLYQPRRHRRLRRRYPQRRSPPTPQLSMSVSVSKHRNQHQHASCITF